ncbi:MAG TPA: MFS transporter [Methylomirabilota bacterium]|jgi:MFS family permease|nr:MFS transporter [Methylomirabilota bacterium]
MMTTGSASWSPGASGILAGAFLFNLGQGVLRPTMPLYLQATFSASYRMVTSIPTVFAVGKWIASLPTGYFLDRAGRLLMISGLLLIALCDVASVLTSVYWVFLALRALAGVGWAMFGTVATTAMVDVPSVGRRGRAVSLLLMSETSGLLLGSAAGGWLYRGAGGAGPFVFEAACMVVAAVVAGTWTVPAPRSSSSSGARHRGQLAAVVRTPGVLLMGLISATLIAIQTGALVFLFPLYLANRAGLSPETVGLIIALIAVGRLAALLLGGGLSDRWGRLRVLIPGLLSYAALLAGLMLLTHPIVLGLWSMALGAAAGLVAAIPTALVGDQTPSPLRGVAIGWLRAMTDVGHVFGPLLMGALADAIDLSAPFLLGAALLAVMAGLCRGRLTS